MKVVLLAGGLGTRISEESEFKPKPMIEIGGMPILWHIMKEFSYYGFNEFIICAGYKQEIIKKWFVDYSIIRNDVTFDFENNNYNIHNNNTEPWKVTIVDTGLTTQTGGRIKRIEKYLGNDEEFILTYGDGVADLDIKKLVEFHHNHGKLATVSVYNFGQNKGVIDFNPDGSVAAFREKSDMDGDLINIGFMVCEPEVFDYIHDDVTPFESGALAKLANEGKVNAYIHKGFWQCMDTLREKEKLEKLWYSNNCPWKIWKD